MVGYVTLGTKDVKRAGEFYDQLLGLFSASRFMDGEAFIAWSTEAGGASLAVGRPFDQKASSVGNGVMVALAADSKEQVDALYAKAIELGGTDEGPPGPRGDTFYAAYFRDLDGNKLNAFFAS